MEGGVISRKNSSRHSCVPLELFLEQNPCGSVLDVVHVGHVSFKHTVIDALSHLLQKTSLLAPKTMSVADRVQFVICKENSSLQCLLKCEHLSRQVRHLQVTKSPNTLLAQIF